MQQNEVNTIVQNIPYLDRTDKELNRYKLYVSVQSNSKKKVKMEDILPLVWDKENKNTGTLISEDEANERRNKAKELEKRIQNMTFTTIDMNDMYKNTHMNNNG